ncbi:hypothetical protein [Paraburkholderia sp. GAS32]|uniref:hypothetical protein n=1 Tax=Paraburkholderia sp. GAS32 TaxID=3035129 RepID=UPI003D26302C
MDLLNDRVYPRQHIEQWLVEQANVTRGSRTWMQALKNAGETTLGGDTYLFERVSDTHYRVHRANAEDVGEVMAVLNQATSSRGERFQMIAMASVAVILCAFGLIGMTVSLVRHFILHSY